jgi:hypothetical protein
VNRDLYGTSKGETEFPKDMREHLKVCFSKVGNTDGNTEGYKRNKELQDKKFIDYKVLKRIKNFFDNFKGNEKDPEFILNGEFKMKNWVNNELRRMREYQKMTKNNKMNIGMPNQFIQTHSKDGLDNIRPSKEHSKNVDKYNIRVTESVRRINEIISKI